MLRGSMELSIVFRGVGGGGTWRERNVTDNWTSLVELKHVRRDDCQNGEFSAGEESSNGAAQEE